MRYPPIVVGLALLSLAQGCAELIEPPQTRSDPGVLKDMAPPPDDGGGGGTAGTWPYFAPRGNNVYEASDPPNGVQTGIWLGWSVTPDRCFGDRTVVLNDRDYDRLDDNCELELARAFAPHWGMAGDDGCPQGEPYWAAKYFPSQQLVRIAFMPAYYKDCGNPQVGFAGAGHYGDSEFVMVTVAWNAANLRWEFRQMWLSAHYGEDYGADRSMWADVSQTTFTKRHLGHPYVEVSRQKHANYTNMWKCQQALIDFENCNNGGNLLVAFRFPIVANRNVGSRLKDLVGCVLSTDPARAANGRRECFYTERPFNGWNAGSGGVRAYSRFLNSIYFESYFGDWGPSQGSPVVTGPTALEVYQTGTWRISWIKPLSSCRWYVDGWPVKQGDCTYSRSFADAQSTMHTMQVYVTDAAGESFGPVPYSVNVHVPGHQKPPL